MAMAKPAHNISPGSAASAAYYELPLSERMRTFLRLEFLYQQMLYSCDDESGWATRATVATLLDILDGQRESLEQVNEIARQIDLTTLSDAPIPLHSATEAWLNRR